MPEVILNDISVRFPFEPYEVQKNYMEKVIECLQTKQNGVLESPTGTGKTLCLLCSTLAWLEMKKAEHKAKSISGGMSQSSDHGILSSISTQLQAAVGGMWKPGSGCPKIIYSSRTHSQLSQAVNELKKTTYKHMKISVLGSRDQMCIHPDVSKETNNMNKVHMCQVRVKGRNCYFYNQVEHKRLDTEVKDQILDLEDLVKLGKKRTFCPYYMAKEIRQDADIIFLPYNYLLDPKSRRAHGIELQGNIVILDEAHNVEKMCEESASLQLKSTDLALCIDEVTNVMQKLQEMAESNIGLSDNALLPEDFSAEDLYILKTIFLELEKVIDDIALPSDGSGVTFGGEFMFDLLQKADITPNKKAIIVDVLDKLIQYLTTNSSSPFQRKGAGLQKFSELIKIVYSKDNFTMSYMEFVKQCYKVHVNVEQKRKPTGKEGWNAPKVAHLGSKMGKVISYWCFNPGFGMKDLAEQGVQSIILTSGTLSPLESFTSELQIPLPIQLENPHIIKPCQVWVGTVCHGPDGNMLNSSFQNRSKPAYLNSLGYTILNFSRVIPGGLLVFFPSYPIMKMCQEHWQNSGVWTGIFNSKPVFVEPQSKDGFITAMEEFYEKVNDPNLKGACFLAVCRGKVSEGLDFANRNGRAVIITGLPYPPFKDPRVMLKQKYLEEVRSKTKKGLTGAAWYKLEASRAVNQAIGRVIRHKDDYGAIILCDKRFGDSGFRHELSSWVRPHMKVHEKFGTALKELIQFFRITKNMFPEPVSKYVRKDCGQASTKIEYDDGPCTSMFAVRAKAFQSTSSRPVLSEHTKERILTQVKELDPNAVYGNSKPFLKDKEDIKSKPLFSALNEASSVLDFNTIAPCQGNISTLKECDNFVPKRKKIKLISQSEKDLDSFIKKEATASTRIPEENKYNQPSTDMINSSSGASTSLPPQNTKESSQLKQAKIAKYIKTVKSVLSKDNYKNFSDAIKSYKQSHDADSMIAVLLSLFADDIEKHSLLLKFSLFLRHDHRTQLESVYQDLVNCR